MNRQAESMTLLLVDDFALCEGSCSLISLVSVAANASCTILIL